MKRLTRFIVSLFIVSISLLNMPSANAASSVTLVGKTKDAYYANYNYGTDNSMWANKFVLKDANGVTRVGECITPAKDQPGAGTYSNVSEITDQTLIKILYFSSQTGYGEDLAQKVYTKSHGKSDKQGEIIYIGKADDIHKRLKQHRHLEAEQYQEVDSIEYAVVANRADRDIHAHRPEGDAGEGRRPLVAGRHLIPCERHLHCPHPHQPRRVKQASRREVGGFLQ